VRSPRTVGLLALLIALLTAWGMPRPDDDQLSMRDASGFGSWFDSPQEVEPLYRTVEESPVGPRRTWTVDPAGTRFALEFVSGDGVAHRIPLTLSGALELDARNLDMARGTLAVDVSTLDLGLEEGLVSVDLRGGSVGTMPREVGSRAMGGVRIRVRVGDRAQDVDGSLEVRRQGPDRLEVHLHDLPGLDMDTLGVGGLVARLGSRLGAGRLESQPTARLVLLLRAGQTSSSP